MNAVTHAKVSIELINRVLAYIQSQPTNRPVGEVMNLLNALQQSEPIEEQDGTNEN